MASRFRTWTWTRIDGRNVLAMPTRDEVHLYDSEDFILLDKIAPTGHRSYIRVVRWSAFHGKLLSLSPTQLIVHVPQLVTESNDRGDSENEHVRFVRICDFDLVDTLAGLRSVAFSHCADLLLVGGAGGIGILDIHTPSQRQNEESLRFSSVGDADKKFVWQDSNEKADVVKFSPCSFIFAALSHGEKTVRVWRTVRDSTATNELARRVIHVDALDHPEPVAYASWKPAITQMHAAVEYDGARKARWFEPQRMLLTCTKSSRTIRIWIESDAGGGPTFVPAFAFDPISPLSNVRWVLSKNRNISEEKFQVPGSDDDQQMDWISGVDTTGVLHLYQVVGVASTAPVVRDTELRIKVNGEQSQGDTQAGFDVAVAAAAKLIELEEICVMAYFSQNYFGLPSKLDIVLQRSDGILLSFIIAVGKKKHAHIKKKSWYRSHLGSIAALAAHPSLPLIASVDEHCRGRDETNGSFGNEILIFWISFSAFSAESRLIPSGVLECPPDSGPVLCLQWIPTLHFDATPLFLVAYASGVIDIYGRAANANDVVSSPRAACQKSMPTHPQQLKRRMRSPSLSPWTFFDYATGQSGIEYEVAIQKEDKAPSLGFKVEPKDGVLSVSQTVSTSHAQVSVDDEVVALNGDSLVNKTADEFERMVDAVPSGSVVLVRLRAQARAGHDASDRSPLLPPRISEVPDGDDSAAELPEDLAAARELHRSFLSSAESDFSLNMSYVHAGSVSMYGGWRQLLTAKAASSLHLVCVSPVYADDGEYIPGTVLIFGVSDSLPGTLRVWKGTYSGATSHTFSLVPLHINDGAVLKKHDITSIAGERDYRQRAFKSTKRADTTGSTDDSSFNSLVFVGDAAGSVHHWRCRVKGSTISFAMMSTFSLETKMASPPSSSAFNSSAFFRRGYFNSRHGTSEIDKGSGGGIHHIEVDDPNRIAVLHASRPDALHVFEGESGLGIMRLEETILAEGRGRILGFCWCNAHVEFNVDALAVHYESSIVIYQYDMSTHRWTQVGSDVGTMLATFDCTRDSSALLIGGGHVTRSVQQEEETEEIPIVLGKWDEPGNLLQHAMDWKAVEAPQKLPVWHPYVVVTTLFGMHARVGMKDTTMANDSPTYEFSKAFKDAVQMLKLLAKVLEDDASTRLSASSGVLAYSVPQNSRVGTAATPVLMFMSQIGRHDSIGRYSTSIHVDNSGNKAENLFAEPRTRRSGMNGLFGSPAESEKLEMDESATLTSAIDAVLKLKLVTAYKRPKSNASKLFGSFDQDQLLELKAVLHFIHAVQSLGFELDASAADLCAKRYYAMFLFGRSLRAVLDDPASVMNGRRLSEDETVEDDVEKTAVGAYMSETPSSGVLWALHSSAQAFLVEHCIPAQATWEDLRPMWLALWVRDVKDLRAIVERLAKSTYTKTRDAMDVALYYIALGKKNILGALAKVSKKETNKNLAIFLDNDFSQDRWGTAAIKNAYSLLAKKQYKTAAAFFLLCEPPRLQEAVRLLSVRLQDPGLALLVSRLVEYRMSDAFSHDFISSAAGGASAHKEITPAGEITRRLLEHDVIPLFRVRQDRWLESASLWWLDDFEQACTILMPQSQPIDIDPSSQHDRYHHQDSFIPGGIGMGFGMGSGSSKATLDSVQRIRSVTYFYVNLTSIPIYFQFLHASDIDAPLVSRAIKQILLMGSNTPSSSISDTNGSTTAALTPATVAIAARKHTLASTADIEHAFSFAAYVCKRSGMSDTSLVEMLQARHLVNLHAKVELHHHKQLAQETTDALAPFPVVGSPSFERESSQGELELPTSPRMMSFFQDRRSKTQPPGVATLSRQQSFNGDRHQPGWAASPRRMSELNDMMDFSTPTSPMVQGVKTLLQRSSTVNWSLSNPPLSSSSSSSTSSTGSTPWLKAQIADIECRRWSSSAFVGKMIGIRVAREMITHFRGELDACFRHFIDGMPLRAERHKDFLEELCAPLCEQFQVDRTYVLEAALAVMQPHAYLHIAEICFLLAVLGRSGTLTKWIQYVALSMLKSCGTFASCRITQAIYRDWESLTIQLCYILHLEAQGQISMPHHVTAQVAVAVRTGCVFLSWCKQKWHVVHEAITRPFYSRVGERKSGEDATVYYGDLSLFSFQQNVELIRSLQLPNRQDKPKDGKTQANDSEFTSYGGDFGYLFLRTVAEHWHRDESSCFDSSSQPDSEHESSESAADQQQQKQQQHHNQQAPKLHKMYMSILMVSVLRTLYARAQVFLLACHGAGAATEDGEELVDKVDELDISSSLFTPRKLWKPLAESPLDGLRRWYSLIESHLRCEFDYSVKEDTCICGLYGLDGRSADLAGRVQERISKFENALPLQGAHDAQHHHFDHFHQHHLHFHLGFHHKQDHRNKDGTVGETRHYHYDLEEILDAIGIAPALHQRLVQTSDDYIVLLMRHPKYGVPTTVRRFRLEPRVVVTCFLLKDAFDWFTLTARIFATTKDAQQFLSRCCKQRKMRLLVKHRGQDAHHFPIHLHHHHKEDCLDGDGGERQSISNCDCAGDDQDDEAVARALAFEAMMFVDPWEVEAEGNASRYMHNMMNPVHVELGWDRLSRISTVIPDDIAKAAFHGDAKLCEMWQSTCGEGWLITSIIQYQLDGVHSHRTGHVEVNCVVEEDKKVPYLVEIHSRSQRNALFQEVGLPHRFVGVIKTKLISGRQLIPVKWIEYFSDPYVFLTVSPSEHVDLSYDSWSIQTYRSRCAPGGMNPVWNHAGEDEFTFRFAIPTHKPHFLSSSSATTTTAEKQPDDHHQDHQTDGVDTTGSASAPAAMERLWNATASVTGHNVKDKEVGEVLESLFQHGFTGPPLFLHCAVFHKTKVLSHQFMGRAKVALNPLTSGHPMDIWIPLEDVASGSLHLQISLSFELMCSSVGSGTAYAQSANTYEPTHDMTMSEQSPSTSTNTNGTTVVPEPEVVVPAEDQVPPLPPHLTPREPRSMGNRS